MVPIAPGWARRLLEESVSPRGFWRKGPAQQPRLVHAIVSTHHYHMNSAGLYRLGQPCFVELMRRVRAAYPLAPHDVSTHLFLHDPRHFHLWQTVAHRFLYTDVIQNRLDEWALDDVRAPLQLLEQGGLQGGPSDSNSSSKQKGGHSRAARGQSIDRPIQQLVSGSGDGATETKVEQVL